MGNDKLLCQMNPSPVLGLLCWFLLTIKTSVIMWPDGHFLTNILDGRRFGIYSAAILLPYYHTRNTNSRSHLNPKYSKICYHTIYFPPILQSYHMPRKVSVDSCVHFQCMVPTNKHAKEVTHNHISDNIIFYFMELPASLHVFWMSVVISQKRKTWQEQFSFSMFITCP